MKQSITSCKPTFLTKIPDEINPIRTVAQVVIDELPVIQEQQPKQAA